MPQLALYLFGPPRLELDGVPVHIQRRKALALLIYLAGERDRPHAREIIYTLLWPGMPEKSAQKNLRQTLYALRQAFPDLDDSQGASIPLLLVGRQTIQLNPARELTIDIHQLDDSLASTQTHHHPDLAGCSACIAALEEALALYQADFLADFYLQDSNSYEEWAEAVRQTYRHKLIDILITLSDIRKQNGDYQGALTYIDRLLVIDDLSERVHRQKMEVLARSGRRVEAMRQHQSFAQRLEEQLKTAPSQETTALYERIRSEELAADLPQPGSTTPKITPPRHNLPVQVTPFIGRESELAEIRAKLKENDCQLLILLGPGGSGKTRLAIEAAGALLDDYRHGIFFVNLAPLQSADLIFTTIATSLKFSFQEQGSPEEQLLDYLQNKQMLLILDNFEHLLDGTGFVNQIIHTAPAVKILVTSRSRLMVTGEHLYDVWGLTYPETSVSLEIETKEYSALKLFKSEASRVQANFELSKDNLSDVIRICSLLEGIPLGIVLAASWVTMLSPGEIAVEIDRDLAFLDTELRDLPRRQRSLQSVFNRSWRLLSENQRRVLAALSVFRGSFTGEAAQEVADASLRDLKGLMDQSMLHRTSSGRYEMHELLRQYTAEKLTLDSTVEAKIRENHSDYYCHALSVWERELQGPLQVAARQEMVLEIDNIRAAWAWAVENLRFKQLLAGINGLGIFYIRNCQLLEGVETCNFLRKRLNAIGIEEHTRPDIPDEVCTIQVNRQKLYVRVLTWGEKLNSQVGNRKLAWKLAEECLSSLERSDLVEQDIRFEKAVVYLGYPWIKENVRLNQANHFSEEALRLFKSLDEPWWVGTVLASLAALADSTDDRIMFLEKKLAISRKIGDLSGIAESLGKLSWEAAYRFEFEKAEALLQEALAINAELENVFIYATLGTHWVWQARFDEAHSLIQDTLASYHDQGYTPSIAAGIHALAGYPDQYLGAYEAARGQAQHALELYSEVKTYNVSTWSAVAIEILVSVALAEGSYAEADGWFQKCPRPLHPSDIAKLLACHGFAARGLGQTTQAQLRFYQALSMAIERKHYVPLIHTLPGIALLYADQGEVERAVELYALASTFDWVAKSRWFADVAGDEIAAAAEELPIEIVEAAQARGRELDLWEAAAKLLEELDKLDWGSGGMKIPEMESE